MNYLTKHNLDADTLCNVWQIPGAWLEMYMQFILQLFTPKT